MLMIILLVVDMKIIPIKKTLVTTRTRSHRSMKDGSPDRRGQEISTNIYARCGEEAESGRGLEVEALELGKLTVTITQTLPALNRRLPNQMGLNGTQGRKRRTT